jgi:DinB superfamily
MPLLPEQQQALDYARKRGTEAPAEAIRTRVVATYAELEALINAVPADLAREHRESSLWSIQEVVDHLVESERPGIEQLARLLAGRDVDEAIPASLQSANPLALDWSDLRRELRRIHQELLALLATATDDLPLTATAAVEMVVKCAQPDGSLVPVTWPARVDWKAYAVLLLHAHNRQHIAQIQRILNAPPP